MRLALTASACILLFLAGCSSSQESSEKNSGAQVDVAKRYISAQAEGRWPAMCQEMSQRSQRAISQSFQGGSCTEAIANSPKAVRENFREFASSVQKIEAGSNNTVRLQTGSDTSLLEMTREKGAWKVAPV